MNIQKPLQKPLFQWMKLFILGLVVGIFLFVPGKETDVFVIQEASAYGREYPVQEMKIIALTFDDGPHEKWTPALLDGLKERGVKATFFLMGENIAGNEELVQRMAQEGHLIGNHSYTHVQLTKEGMDEVCESFEKTSQIIEELTGERPQYVRPPYGDWNEELECRTNLTTVLWDVDTLDT